ncbi:MAG: nitrous oxide-stimulated promoter family protein [Phycisphaerae bacterium]
MRLALTQHEPDPRPDPTLDRDLKTLARFIDIYCRHTHADVARGAFALKGFDGPFAAGRRPLLLCPACTRLLSHAFVKRAHCPFSPKPACKHCQSHCYQPGYREQIRAVMRFSGRKLVLSGRLDMLFKLLF